MVKTRPPAGNTSPIFAMRYWMRPSRGATSVLSDDVDLVKFGIVGRGVDWAIGFADAILCGVERGDRAIEGLPTLVERFVGGEAVGDQRVGSIELLLRERHLSRLLHDVGPRLIEALLGLLDL